MAGCDPIITEATVVEFKDPGLALKDTMVRKSRKRQTNNGYVAHVFKDTVNMGVIEIAVDNIRSMINKCQQKTTQVRTNMANQKAVRNYESVDKKVEQRQWDIQYWSDSG